MAEESTDDIDIQLRHQLAIVQYNYEGRFAAVISETLALLYKKICELEAKIEGLTKNE